MVAGREKLNEFSQGMFGSDALLPKSRSKPKIV